MFGEVMRETGMGKWVALAVVAQIAIYGVGIWAVVKVVLWLTS